jgi:two-component system nitrogen regulation response regulator GlnG
MARLLLVDHDPALISEQIHHLFRPGRLEMQVAGMGAEALRLFLAWPPDVVLLNANMPDVAGLELYQQLRQIDARVPVIFFTATSTADAAIEAMRRGAHDYLLKPVDSKQLETVMGGALDLARRMREPARVGTSAGTVGGDAIIGQCPAMLEVYKAIGRVADQKVTVLITGESGTGKELVARAIYQHSDRASLPFITINCASIPESLLESELFGHERGAFTGAERRRIGKFEQCNGGTIFLDEIGDMPPATQGKILRLLQGQRFERVGGNDTIQTDVRLIAATNRDLKTWSAEGKFRLDLYFRLSVITIHLPPLRQRGEDLPLLVQYYLERISREFKREVCQAAPAALEQICEYTWPGNVRELQSILKQALLRSKGRVLLPQFLPPLSEGALGTPSAGHDGKLDIESFVSKRLSDGGTNLHAEAHLELDRRILPVVVAYADGSQIRAAKLLGISRQTLRNRLRQLGMNVTKSVAVTEHQAN